MAKIDLTSARQVKGALPVANIAAPGGTSTFLRADQTWATPAGSSAPGYSFVGNFRVATPGDNFIAVNLDADNNQIYRATVVFVPSINAALSLTISDDAGATWKTGAADYKTVSAGSGANIAITGTGGAARNCMAEFTLQGMNDAAATAENGWMQLMGNHRTVDSGGSPTTGVIGGSTNALAAGNWNAFRLLASAGNLNSAHVLVYSMRIV